MALWVRTQECKRWKQDVGMLLESPMDPVLFEGRGGGEDGAVFLELPGDHVLAGSRGPTSYTSIRSRINGPRTAEACNDPFKFA